MIVKESINNEYYLINKSKGLVIRQTRSTQIVNMYNIPLYEGKKVHYKDVVCQLIKNAFDSIGEEYMPNNYVQGKIDRRWKNKWKKSLQSRRKMLDMVDLYMAGRLLIDKFRLIKQQNNDK